MMIDSFLAVDAATVKAPRDRSATGNIWLDVGGCKFPAEGWNDFVVVVLGWWANALLRLLRSDSANETVNFMDGPYTVEVSMTSAGMLRFRALEGIGRHIEKSSGDALPIAFVESLILQSHEVISACRRQGWWSKDAEYLASSLELLQLELHRFSGRL
jgi:hypothetical protein